MKSNLIAKKTKAGPIRRALCLLLVVLLLFGSIPVFESAVGKESSAATTKTLGEELVTIARSYAGKSFASVKSEMQKKNFEMFAPNYDYAWCAWFVSNCAREARVPLSLIPNNTWASFEWYFSKVNKFKSSARDGGSYKPKTGDLIFFDGGRRDGDIWHVGIVIGSDSTRVYTIEGNTSYESTFARVWAKTYALDSSVIVGYADTGLSKLTKTSSGTTTVNNSKNVIANGLHKVDGEWRYYEDGAVKNTTGLVKCVQAGDSGYGKWYYIKNGKLSKETGLVKCVQPGISYGKWYYVKNGKLCQQTGVVQRIQPGGTYGSWYYVVNGKWNRSTGLAKVIQPGEYKGKWRYVYKGQYNTATTGLVKSLANGKWYYVINGDYARVSGVVQSTKNGRWYYVYLGDYTKYTGWSQKRIDWQWVYVTNGEWKTS